MSMMPPPPPSTPPASASADSMMQCPQCGAQFPPEEGMPMGDAAMAGAAPMPPPGEQAAAEGMPLQAPDEADQIAASYQEMMPPVRRGNAGKQAELLRGFGK